MNAAVTCPPFVHDTAIVEDGVLLGQGTKVWDNAHVRAGARVGRDCIVGEKTYIAYDVVVGDRCKLNASVYVCAGVTLEDGVMVSAGTVFTNDRFPRATTPDLRALRSSAPDENTLSTRVREGATIGANAMVGPGLVIGRFAMIGMGSVVTRDVGDFHLAFGAPARSVAFVCRCGTPLCACTVDLRSVSGLHRCRECDRRYIAFEGSLAECV